MKAFLVFLIILIIIALFCWRGSRRGIILTIAGIIVFTLAFEGGNLVAKSFSGQFSSAISPLISSPVESACKVAIGLEGRVIKDENGNKIIQEPETPEDFDGTVKSAAYFSFLEVGFAQSVAEQFSDEISNQVDDIGTDMYTAISDKVARVVAFIMVFVLTAVIIIIAASAISNLINFSAEFPGYNKINKIGGAIFGLFFGVVVLYGVGWILKFSGVFLKDILENTILGKFTAHNPFTNMMGF